MVTQLTKRTGGGKGVLVSVQSTTGIGHNSAPSSSERDGVLGSLHGDG